MSGDGEDVGGKQVCVLCEQPIHASAKVHRIVIDETLYEPVCNLCAGDIRWRTSRQEQFANWTKNVEAQRLRVAKTRPPKGRLDIEGAERRWREMSFHSGDEQCVQMLLYQDLPSLIRVARRVDVLQAALKGVIEAIDAKDPHALSVAVRHARAQVLAKEVAAPHT